jgi:hypothetical protein
MKEKLLKVGPGNLMILGVGLIWLISLVFFPGVVMAKTDLFLSPASGSYVINNNFSVAVKINHKLLWLKILCMMSLLMVMMVQAEWINLILTI